jgi:hypothetical protein
MSGRIYIQDDVKIPWQGKILVISVMMGLIAVIPIALFLTYSCIFGCNANDSVLMFLAYLSLKLPFNLMITPVVNVCIIEYITSNIGLAFFMATLFIISSFFIIWIIRGLLKGNKWMMYIILVYYVGVLGLSMVMINELFDEGFLVGTLSLVIDFLFVYLSSKCLKHPFYNQEVGVII